MSAESEKTQLYAAVDKAVLDLGEFADSVRIFVTLQVPDESTTRHRRDTPFQRKSFGDITKAMAGVSEKIQ